MCGQTTSGENARKPGRPRIDRRRRGGSKQPSFPISTKRRSWRTTCDGNTDAAFAEPGDANEEAGIDAGDTERRRRGRHWERSRHRRQPGYRSARLGYISLRWLPRRGAGYKRSTMITALASALLPRSRRAVAASRSAALLAGSCRSRGDGRVEDLPGDCTATESHDRRSPDRFNAFIGRARGACGRGCELDREVTRGCRLR